LSIPQMMESRIVQKKHFQLSGSPSIRSVRFSRVCCGLHLYHSLIQVRISSFIKQGAKALTTQVVPVSLKMFARPGTRAKQNNAHWY